jgi:hypothetical protein
MPLETFYLEYKDAFSTSQQLNYVNLNMDDTQTSKTGMTEGVLYDSAGNDVGSSQIISFIRNGIKSTNVTSMLSLFTQSGLLNFNIVRRYDATYNPLNDIVTAEALYATGAYKNGNPVYLRLEPIGSYPNIVLKLSIFF